MDKNLKKLLEQGIIKFKNKNFDIAENIFKKIYTSSPRQIFVLTYLIPTLIHLNRLDDALHYSKILLDHKENELGYTYHGIIYFKLNDMNKSILYLDKVLQLNPKNFDALLNKGVALHKKGLNEKGLYYINSAININSHNPIAYHSLATIYEDENMIDEAIKNFNKSISLNPNDFNSLHSLSLLQLMKQNYFEGFRNYEYRFQTFQIKSRHSHIPKLTKINEIKGKKILIWSEQGLGDTIQFSRYLDVLKEYGAVITFEVQKDLVNFLKRECDFEVISDIKNDKQFDFQLALLSIPYFLISNNLNPIIKQNKFYRASDEKIIFWKNELNLNNMKLNIGIAISGNKKHIKEKRRKINLFDIEHLSKYFNIFIIQKEISEQENRIVNKNPNIFYLGNNSNWKDMSDTAAIVENMDKIISIDTSLIHLSGSINKKSYLLLSKPADWRWSEKNESMHNWYSSVKVLRQDKKNSWSGVIKNLNLELGIS